MRFLAVPLIALLLCACAGAPKARMFPPGASVQELRVEEDGRWRVSVRVQNFARLAIRVEGVDAQLTVDGVAAGKVAASTDLPIPPNSADPVDIVIQPTPAAADALALAVSEGRSVSYTLEGSVRTIEPSRRSDAFRFDSRLSPAPGLPGTLR
jgi:hypothetical protein